MENTVKAQAKYIGRSPRKARLVVNAVRGMHVNVALANLKYMNKGAALEVYKVVASAAANGQHNMKMNPSSLYIKEIFVDEAPMLKRYRAESKGKFRRILKRSCHITVVLAEDNREAQVTTAKKKKAAKSEQVDAVAEVTTEAKVEKKSNSKSSKK